MPNFHTHWVVALGAIDQAPKYVQSGWDAYKVATLEFKRKVLAELLKVDRKAKATTFGETIAKLSKGWHEDIGLRATYDQVPWYKPKGPPKWAACRDDVTCFAAYMLGACGPDFWAVLSDTGLVIPDSALDQFNLGHYNRSHRQFQASIRMVGNGDTLPARVQKAYFHGMATHVAADLVVHELVNVSAGAYNLLHQLWISEQATGAIETKKSWTMHNKVEHYWDSIVRYGYFGDISKLAGPERVASGDAGNPCGFLTRDGLLALAKELDPPRKDTPATGATAKVDATKQEAARKNDLEAARAELASVIGKEGFRRTVEKPFLFPLPFCDRALDTADIPPFIYEVVVTTAHPADDVHPVIANERTSPQMKDAQALGGHSERHKLEYFSSAFNESTGQKCSLNYLNYTVCPSVARAARFGRDQFYALGALRPFVDCGIRLAQGFLAELGGEYEKVEDP